MFLGFLYFLGVTIVHMTGFKIPVLFIYYDVPSYDYQDKIISFMAFGWSLFFFLAFTDTKKYLIIVKAILICGAFAIIGLVVINMVTDFKSLNQAIQVNIVWIETAGLFMYWLWLLFFYLKSIQKQA